MTKKILIIGQGISGTLLSWYLYKAGIPFVVIDNNAAHTASKVAAGIINPVTGRRIVKTWMIDELIPFAVNAYTEIGDFFNQTYITKNSMVDFFATEQMATAFADRLMENADYLAMQNDIDYNHTFNYNYGYGYIQPTYTVAVQSIVANWRNYLQQQHLLITTEYSEALLKVTDSVIMYDTITASHIVYANGEQCSSNNYFKNLPFAPNKGEALLIECNELPANLIFKKGLTIAPIGTNLYWVGANYIWNYEDALPTQSFYNDTNLWLQQFVKVPYTIVAHKAAIRPANLERRPFVGFHPTYKNVGILNGMGAKGTSLAPYFANQLVQYITHQQPILAEADVLRFSKILQKTF